MNAILYGIGIYFVVISFVILVLNVIQTIRNNKYKSHLNKIEFEKNVIDSIPILAEIAKIKTFLKSDKLDSSIDDWEEKYKLIRGTHIPNISDMILETEYTIKNSNSKTVAHKIVKLELEIYKVKVFSNLLLSEIKEITSSEEKNRNIITKFKTIYRELYEAYTKNKNEYQEVSKSIELQFENIAKRFELFEISIENSDFEEVTNIINSLDEMLNHMAVVLDEIPSILLMGNNLLPKKIADIKKMYSDMKRAGYPLDYLNVDYNIDEALKKINNINERIQILNLEDSLFELKVLMDYFESLFTDFEKESSDRKIYEDLNFIFKKKVDRINLLINDVFRQLESMKSEYDLSKDEIKVLQEVKKEMSVLNSDYEILLTHTGNNTFAFSKLIKEIDNLTIRLNYIEEKMENSLSLFDNMKEDEIRAREQLDEIKALLRESKGKMREYKFPIIPKFYFTELNEASEAIKEIVKELEKKPIAINTLNTRVDTARDLGLKLLSRTNDMIKTAKCAEMAIVYGNRYRVSYKELDKNLLISEELFYEGNFKKSLDNSLEMLNKLEPGIYNSLLKRCEK